MIPFITIVHVIVCLFLILSSSCRAARAAILPLPLADKAARPHSVRAEPPRAFQGNHMVSRDLHGHLDHVSIFAHAGLAQVRARGRERSAPSQTKPRRTPPPLHGPPSLNF